MSLEEKILGQKQTFTPQILSTAVGMSWCGDASVMGCNVVLQEHIRRFKGELHLI